MSSRTNADPEWDSHKAEIEDLYVREDVKLGGPGGLMETMARKHGFEKR